MRKVLPLFAVTTALLSACGTQSAPQIQASTEPGVHASSGKQNTLSGQIVGGTISARGARPYQVAMTTPQGSQYCGGTLISSSWVLTAAHCVVDSTASSIRIRAGVNKLSDPTQGQIVGVSNVYVHPSYGGVSRGYDIALLKLSTAVNNPYAAPAKLPSNAIESILDVKGKFAVVSGWGLTQGNGSPSDVLREVSLPITPNPVSCGGSSAPANTICGEYYQGKDSCNGDSGGPLAQSYNGSFYVLGIVSYGPTACTGNGIYTRVNGYLNWIQQVSGITPDSSTAPTTGTTRTYSGSVSQGYDSYQPGSTGFSYAGGTIRGNLSASSTTDFDLYLQKKTSTGTWADVAASENSGSTESISYNATSGTYRWAIYAYSGSGSYSLTETK